MVVRSVPVLWGNLLLIQETSNMDFSADKCLKLVLTLVMCSKHMFHGYPACCSHHMCGVHTSGCMDAMCSCGCHMVVCCILIGQPTHCSWPCVQWLHPDWPVTHWAAHELSGCRLLHAVCSYMEHHTLWIAMLELFSVLTSVQLLMNIFCHLLVFIFWQFTHVIWVTDLCTRFQYQIHGIYEFAICRQNKQ